MKNKTTNSQSVLPNLPDDLIMEQILPRLPVKSLTRFKSVCKYWLFTILSHKFINTHLKFSSSRLQALIFYGEYIDEGSCFLSFDECNNLNEVELDYNLITSYPHHFPIGGRYCYVIGSCCGLVCLFEMSFCFYIWNPATNQCHDVSCPDFDHHLPDDITGMVFGYVSSIDDYRIWLLICDEGLCYIYVYSLRAQKWKTMPSFDTSNENYDFRIGERPYEGVVVDDTLNWPPELPRHEDKEAHIAGLNLVDGKMNKFPLMKLLIGYDYDVRVFRMKGCLSMCCKKYVNGDYSSCVTDVWMLKHLNDWNSWEKVLSFNIGDMNLLWIFETGECLALKRNEEGTAIWLGSNKQIYFEDDIEEAWGYAESLISPFGTTISDENEDHHETEE